MSVFGKILEKLGLRKEHAPSAATTGRSQAGAGSGSTHAPSQTATQSAAPGTQRTAPPPPPGTGAQGTRVGTASGAQAQPRATQPAPMSETDVVAKLEKLAADNPQKLNWRTSIVDLMKLLDMESSLAERRELATELGYKEDMGDSAKMNVWLHRQVLRRIAENGGNVPKELLD